MHASSHINTLLSRIRQLDKVDQRHLYQQLSHLINDNVEAAPASTLLELAGLGSQLWSGTDIDKYIEAERQW